MNKLLAQKNESPFFTNFDLRNDEGILITLELFPFLMRGRLIKILKIFYSLMKEELQTGENATKMRALTTRLMISIKQKNQNFQMMST